MSQRTKDAFQHKRSRGDSGLIAPKLETRIVKLYKDDRLSMQKIADRLNEERVPTARNGKWTASTVHRVIERADD